MSDGNQGRNRTQPAPPAATTPPADEARAMTDAEKAAAHPQMEAAANHALADLHTMTEERDAAIKERDEARRDAGDFKVLTTKALRERDAAREEVESLTAELTELRTTRNRRGGAVSSVITRTPSKEAKEKGD